MKYDLSGQRFGRLIVLDQYRSASHGQHPHWLCQCDCGNIKWIVSCSLKSGFTKSCGCLRQETTAQNKPGKTHGHCTGPKRSRTYKSWDGMIQRCTNPRNKDYRDYGGRGILVCDGWLGSFENFLADMGERPEATSIDRIDNNGNYEPGNCRWATSSEQNKNKRLRKL